MHRAHVRYRKTTVLQQKNGVDLSLNRISSDAAPLEWACGKADSHGFGRALRWHTTHRNADDRKAPARSERPALPRNKPSETASF